MHQASMHLIASVGDIDYSCLELWNGFLASRLLENALLMKEITPWIAPPRNYPPSWRLKSQKIDRYRWFGVYIFCAIFTNDYHCQNVWPGQWRAKKKKFTLFCPALLYSVLFCSFLFCSVWFGSVRFCSAPFCSVLFCSALLCSVLFCLFLLCSVFLF